MAGTKRIDVQLSYDDAAVRLRVTDDGAGFDPAQLKQVREGHFGWRGIGERAEQIRAKVDLKSQPGRGTEVTTICPT